jgi:hypothetical protein
MPVMRERFCIAFHNMTPPFGADDLARDNAIELERLLGCTFACTVTVEKHHRRLSRGNLFRISIGIMMSGQRFVVHRNPPEGQTHEGLHTAIADAFRAAWRALHARGLGEAGELTGHPGYRGNSPVWLAQRGRMEADAAP